MSNADVFLVFDGLDDYVEIPDGPDFSVVTTGALSVSAWMRPDVLTFPVSEGTGYVHWLGKGDAGEQEWTFRMYNATTTDVPPRPSRISFYVFNADGHLGIGSYVEEPVTVGEWIHLVGTVDTEATRIYKNGQLKDCDRYRGTGPGPCRSYPPSQWITPQRGTAPVRIGTRDLKSFFQGAIRDVRCWNRTLTGAEIAALYSANAVPQDGLVAEYVLTRDIVPDGALLHNGTNFGATWSPQQQ